MNRSIIALSVLFIIASITSVSAWLDCTPSACASGYTDNGQYCSGGTCYRNCTIPVCTTTWTQVHTSNCGWNSFAKSEDLCQTSSYIPTNYSACYKFTYDGPAAISNNIFMNVNDAGEVCDSEAIGGFWDTTNGDNSNPWFSSMSNYLGTTPGDPEYDYLLKIMRAHTEADSDDAYMNDVSAYGEIYCANNSVACQTLGGSSSCDADCYGHSTLLLTHQGYYNDSSTPDNTLYADKECGNAYVSNNRIRDTNTFTVYSAPLELSNSDKSCDRTNEPPIVANMLILPFNATAGHDLLCNYTYSDPENYSEQGSFFEWWRTGVNQNINNSVLNYANLSSGDSWYCRVSPGDGLTNGTRQQSNTVSILSTVRNVTLSVENRQVWKYPQGFFVGPEQVFNMTTALNDALQTCTADAEGYCTLNLTFSSLNTGRVNLTRLGIYYYTTNSPPNVTLVTPSNNSFFSASSTVFNCSANDDSGLANITLYGNWSGGWHANQTNSVSGVSNSTTFTINGLGGTNTWNCLAYDQSGGSALAVANRTFTVDAIMPQYANILEYPTDPTTNYSSSAQYRFNITWTDDIAINTVILEFNGINYTDISQNGNIYGKTFTGLNGGLYSYRWYANDTAGNLNVTTLLTYTINESNVAFNIVNSSGTTLVWFGDKGYLVTRGTVQQSSSYQSTASDAFVIQNNGENVFIVTQNGTIQIDGLLYENQPVLTSSDSRNDFRIKSNDDTLVAYVNESGHVFLKGSIIENGNP